MKSIGIVIAALSEIEEKEFYEYLEKKGKEKGSLPMQLFELYRRSPHKTESQILKELGIKETNYFYQVRHRLKAILENFILEQAIQSENNYFTEVSNYLNIAAYLRNKNLHEKALKTLMKAEKICELNSDFELLSLVYSHMLTIAQVYPEIEVYEIIQKKKEAKRKLEIFNNLEIDYSQFKYELYKSNYSLPPDEILQKLDNYVKEFHLYDLTKLESFNLQYKVLTIIIEIMMYKEDSYELFKIYEKHFNEWDQQLLFHKRNIEKKLSLTYRMCLYLFKQFRFEECNIYLDRYFRDLQMPEAEILGSHLLLYYQVKTVVLAYTGKVNNAIFATLDIMERNLINNRVDIHFIFFFNLANYYFLNGNYENSLDIFLKLERKKNFVKYLTEPVKLNINIYKSMIMILLKKKDITLLKLLEQYLGSLDNPYASRKTWFIKILIEMNKNKNWSKDTNFLNEINRFLDTKTRLIIGDDEHLCFNSFLKALLHGTSYGEEFYNFVEQEYERRTGNKIKLLET